MRPFPAAVDLATFQLLPVATGTFLREVADSQSPTWPRQMPHQMPHRMWHSCGTGKFGPGRASPGICRKPCLSWGKHGHMPHPLLPPTRVTFPLSTAKLPQPTDTSDLTSVWPCPPPFLTACRDPPARLAGVVQSYVALVCGLWEFRCVRRGSGGSSSGVADHHIMWQSGLGMALHHHHVACDHVFPVATGTFHLSVGDVDLSECHIQCGHILW